ncbi:MAG: stage III sporulation AC/AD family protein [Oscillospiraceae bacterium]|nr:stage III sporulation AC/AD family protein [Oscillospiraceae bacterium]
MTLFLQVCGAVLLAVILVLALKSHNKEIGTILAIAVCCMCTLAAFAYLQPVLDFLQTLENLGGLNDNMVKILLKVTGIGIVMEIANLVCKDAGNESMGKSLQLVGTAVILYLSIPLFNALLDLMQKILGEL